MSDLLRSVLDPLFLRKINRLRLTVRHSFDTRPGNTPMPRGSQPSGLEIANHRVFADGDDPRYLDWNAYGRLDQLLVKTFRAEREAPLHILIDTSASMGIPVADHKLAFAGAVAASLAYISLRHQDPVRLVGLGGAETAEVVSPVFRHVRRLPEMETFLRRLAPQGPTALAERVERYLRLTRLPGVAIVLSDFLVPRSDYEHALERLYGRGCAVAALRVIGTLEKDPGHLPRRVRLRDAETGGERTVTMTAVNRQRYVDAFEDHLAQLKRWCEAHAVAFAVPDTAQGLENCLFDELPRAGLLH